MGPTVVARLDVDRRRGRPPACDKLLVFAVTIVVPHLRQANENRIAGGDDCSVDDVRAHGLWRRRTIEGIVSEFLDPSAVTPDAHAGNFMDERERAFGAEDAFDFLLRFARPLAMLGEDGAVVRIGQLRGNDNAGQSWISPCMPGTARPRFTMPLPAGAPGADRQPPCECRASYFR